MSGQLLRFTGARLDRLVGRSAPTQAPRSTPPSQDRHALADHTVAVLLATYNGGQHISAQLASLAGQTHKGWRIVVSDDGSTDDTLEQVAAFAASHDQREVEVRNGPRRTARFPAPTCDPRQPAAANFLSLLSDTAIDADCFALCDQDDVWHPEKMERALARLGQVPDGVPGLYCSRTRLVGATGQACGLSSRFNCPPSFRNALVQSIGGGNTMVLNRAARDLVAAAGPVTVVAHDWWLYMLVAGAGGWVYYDPAPMVDYRQHDGNLVGANQDTSALWDRVQMVLSGGFSQWMDLNLAALHQHEHLLTAENHALLNEFRWRRHRRIDQRLGIMTRLGLHRQTWRGQAALALAILADRI